MNKNVIIIFTLVLISCCNTPNKIEGRPGKVIITGKIKNQIIDSTNNQITASFCEYGNGDVTSYLSAINKDGSFSISFPNQIPQTIWINYSKRFDLIVHPGDSIFVEFDATKKGYIEFLKSLKFSGDASESNMGLNLYLINFYKKDVNYITNNNEITPEDFKLKADSIRGILLENRETFLQKNKVNKDVQNWSLYSIEIGYLTNLLDYVNSRLKFDPENRRATWDLPDDYYDFLKSMPKINKSSLIYSNTGSGFINYYRHMYLFPKLYLENINKAKSANVDSTMILEIIQKCPYDLLRQLLLVDIFTGYLDSYNIKGYENQIKTINKYITEPFLRESLNNQYLKIKTDFENPRLLSEIIQRNPDSDGSIDFLKNILTENFGKVIYIDCFGTWCAPCIEELPYSQKLIKKYENKEIVFVFLCFLSDKQRYDALISNLNLGGKHYFLDINQSKTLSSKLMITCYPFYLLLNKEGQLIQQGSHLRPSKQSTIELINNLLAI